ncbi:hypothetical protein OB905_01445 [Halobacteria archaeon AArc-dxtr1]|nr:hypothetical protein [Halobacteria archaeon AArc-dxtr1]
MPDREQREESISALVVKEAVERGMETGFRDQIVEAVDEADGGGSTPTTKVSLASALVGLGVAIGYLLGRGDLPSEDLPLEEIETPEAVEEATTDDTAEASDEDDTESETDAESGRSKVIPALVLLAGAAAGFEFLRRRMGGDEEWEPIEEFEPATDATFGDEESADDEQAETSDDKDEADSDEEASSDDDSGEAATTDEE